MLRTSKPNELVIKLMAVLNPVSKYAYQIPLTLIYYTANAVS